MSKYGDNEQVASGFSSNSASIDYIASSIEHTAATKIPSAVEIAQGLVNAVKEIEEDVVMVTEGTGSEAVKHAVGSVHEAAEIATNALNALLLAKDNLEQYAQHIRGH